MSPDLVPSFDTGDPAHHSFRAVEGGFPLFDAVVKALPNGTKVLRAADHGEYCSWFRIGRIEAVDNGGNHVQYFVKYGTGTIGRELLGSEYQAQCKLYSLMPDNVPRPMNWGSLQLRAPHEGSYLLAEFVQFDNSDLPDVDAAGAVVAKLHDSSRGTSQQFGTTGPLFDGLLCYLSGWEPKWQTLFAKVLFQVYHYNTLTNGRWDELHDAIMPVIRYVVPRLLNALEDGGRKIEPCFIHGDLWNGNFGTAADTKRLYLFDSSGYYAHHEMEFALWRTQHHRMHEKDYCGAYFKHRPPSEPEEEFEDRVLLYTLKPCLIYSSMNPGHVTRQRALETMKYLLQKYRPQEGSDNPADEMFREITNGEHLWVKELPPEIGSFINARREGLDKDSAPRVPK